MKNFNDGCPGCGRKWVKLLTCECGFAPNRIDIDGNFISVSKRIGVCNVSWDYPGDNTIITPPYIPKSKKIILDYFLPFDLTVEQLKVYLAFR